jgi:hypothetical protein
MKKSNLILGVLLPLLGFGLIWAAEFYLRDLATTDFGFLTFLDSFYPRLQTLVKTWGLGPVIDLLAQVKFRFLVLCAFAWFLIAHWGNATSFYLSEKKALWLVKLFYIFQMLFLPDLLAELSLRTQFQPLYEAHGLMGIWLPYFPDYFVIQFLGIGLFGLSAWLVLSRWKPESIFPTLAAATIWVLWLFLLSAFFGFGKIDHTYASLFSGQMGMLVFLWIWNRQELPLENGYRVFQAFIWACYFFSGLEKVFLSGWEWFSPHHIAVLAALHPGHGADGLANSSFSGILLFGALFFQLASPLQWRWPKWGYVTVLMGILFHLGTFWLLGVGGWFSPWLLMLVFLWPGSEKGN